MDRFDPGAGARSPELRPRPTPRNYYPTRPGTSGAPRFAGSNRDGAAPVPGRGTQVPTRSEVLRPAPSTAAPAGRVPRAASAAPPRLSQAYRSAVAEGARRPAATVKPVERAGPRPLAAAPKAPSAAPAGGAAGTGKPLAPADRRLVPRPAPAALATQLYGRGGSGGGSGGSVAVGASFGGHPFHFDHGHHHHGHHGFHHGFWSHGFHPFWFGFPRWFPWSPSPFQLYGSHFGFGYGHGSWRFSVGFGYSYSPFYYSACPFPFYRTYSYYPYSYYSTVVYYPSYASVYHETYRVVEYVDSYDPYVEYVDDVPVSVTSPRAYVPEIFLSPLVDGFPEGLSATEALSRGEAWLKEGSYLLAAEAFRRVWVARPDDYYAPIRLAVALTALDRYGMAAYALNEGLARNAEWSTRRDDLAGDFPSPAAFEEVVLGMQRHLVRNPTDGDARFLLAYFYFFSGNEFGAHSEFRALKEAGYEGAHLERFLGEAERRLLESGAEKHPR